MRKSLRVLVKYGDSIAGRLLEYLFCLLTACNCRCIIESKSVVFQIEKGRKMKTMAGFDVDKAVEALLYVTHRSDNMYNVLKVLYFADKLHLSQYGRSICDDRYIALDFGPVGSGAYDLVKYARGDGLCLPGSSISLPFAVDGYSILPKRVANQDMLSKSDIECLDEAIRRYGSMSFSRLMRASHDDPAYKDARQSHDHFISLETIVKSLPNSDLVLEYIADN